MRHLSRGGGSCHSRDPASHARPGPHPRAGQARPAASTHARTWTNGTVTVNINLSLRLAALPVALLLSPALACTTAHAQSLATQKVQRAMEVLRLSRTWPASPAWTSLMTCTRWKR
ncbi:hypothetical protein RAA17_04470 [Komagataeibacter rhaeticus]|nr:hypothetical protein [Komagataeibacter rhaeticus]